MAKKEQILKVIDKLEESYQMNEEQMLEFAEREFENGELTEHEYGGVNVLWWSDLYSENPREDIVYNLDEDRFATDEELEEFKNFYE